MPYSYPMQVVMPGQAPQGLPVGMGMVPMSSQGPYPHLGSQGAFPSPAYASAMVPTQGGLMPVNPLQLPFFPGQNQEINQMAAIAAAAMAMQGMFSGVYPLPHFPISIVLLPGVAPRRPALLGETLGPAVLAI
jgi:hypothetical protein